MSLESEVAALTGATTELLTAVNVSKDTLESAVGVQTSATTDLLAAVAGSQAILETAVGDAQTAAGQAEGFATTATSQAGIATTQAGIATAQAVIATTQANNAVAVVTGGTATLTPTAGKIPLAGADGRIDGAWLRTASTARILVNADSIDLATVTQSDTSGTAGINFVQSVTKDTYGRVSGRVVADVRAGTTAQTGILQLSDATNSTSTALAATANAVKTAYDLAAGRQPGDATLTALAGLSTTGLIERTGAGTAGIVTVTAAGKALLDDADAAAQRTTLGLGAIYAPLASPALTGTPTAPTATQGDNDTSIATTAFVNAEIAADAVPASFLTSQIGFRNKLINGAFDIWQRGTTFDGSLGYKADRWTVWYAGAGARATITRVDEGSNYALQIQANTASGAVDEATALVQALEYDNAKTLVGQAFTATLAWSMTATATNTSVRFLVQTSTTANNTNPFDGTWTLVADTGVLLAPATGEQVTTITGVVPATAKTVVVQVLYDANVSNVDGATNTTTAFRIRRVQLEAGTVATPFEHRPIGMELALCQRYYETGTFYNSGGHFDTGYTRLPITQTYAVPKRAAPTVVISNPEICLPNSPANDYANWATAIDSCTNSLKGYFYNAAIATSSRWTFDWTSSAEL